MPSSVRISKDRLPQSTGGQQSARNDVPCIEVMRKTPLFAGLNDEQLRLVTPSCRRLPMCGGRALFSKGDETREVYVVLEGEVCLEEELSMGQHLPPRSIVVERVGKNGVFGLCSLVHPQHAALTARCMEDTDVVVISSDNLRALMAAHSAIGLVVMENAFRIVYERLVCAHHRILTELGLPAMYEVYRNY